MHAAGVAQWFGLWCDGVLAADCGLVRDGALGRFQYVGTHPAWRRRGLCSALVHAVSTWGFAHWRLQTITMVADPDDVAIGIYRSLGYASVLQTLALERGSV
jgi:predicted GNAT family acetyltransferase